jgi:hypothetical protein
MRSEDEDENDYDEEEDEDDVSGSIAVQWVDADRAGQGPVS